MPSRPTSSARTASLAALARLERDRIGGEEVLEVHGVRQPTPVSKAVSKSAGGRAGPASIATAASAKYFLRMQLPYPSAHVVPAHPGPHGRGVRGAVPADLPADGRGRGAVRVPLVRGDPPADPDHAGGRGVRGASSGRSASRSTAPIPTRWRRPPALVTEHYAPEFIDINFGCPVKKVVQRNGGSGCLRDLDLVDRIIRAVIGATHLPVTVKTRSGWSEEQRDPVEHRAANAGRRRPRLHAACPHPHPDVLGRGQLGRDRPGGGGARHSRDRQRRHAERPRTSCGCSDHTGCAGIMVGRGAFGNPWIFRDGAGAAGRAGAAARARAPRSGSASRWSTRGWPFGSRATRARR